MRSSVLFLRGTKGKRTKTVPAKAKIGNMGISRFGKGGGVDSGRFGCGIEEERAHYFSNTSTVVFERLLGFLVGFLLEEIGLLEGETGGLRILAD